MKKPSFQPQGPDLSLWHRLRLSLTGPRYSPFIDPPLPIAPGIPTWKLPPSDASEIVDQNELTVDPQNTPSLDPIDPQPIEALAGYLALSPKNRFAIRPAGEFVATAADLRGQVLELIDHLFVRYPVPLFLYRVMLSEAGQRLVFPGGQPTIRTKRWVALETKYRRWFYAVAQGDSFAQLVKETLNKREAHWFLQAPSEHDVETNLRWARLAALGFPREACDFVLRKFSHVLPDLTLERKKDLARFYARAWAEIRPSERDEIADYIRDALGDPAFCLSGRTAASVRRLSDAWHRRFRQPNFGDDTQTGRRHTSWQEAFADWEQRFGSVLVRAVELTTGRALMEEGAHQGHCVGGYAAACRANRSRIVSLRWFEGDEEITRLTVEIRPSDRRVVQIRGRFNRRPAPEEKEVVRLWADRHDLRIGPNAG